jgi:hypothetical protein
LKETAELRLLRKNNEYLYDPLIRDTVDIPVDVLVKKLEGTWPKLHRTAVNQKNGGAIFGPQILLHGNNN